MVEEEFFFFFQKQRSGARHHFIIWRGGKHGDGSRPACPLSATRESRMLRRSQCRGTASTVVAPVWVLGEYGGSLGVDEIWVEDK